MTRPFGWETLAEKDAIRAKLIAEGHPDKHPDLYFAVERAFVASHADDPTMRERAEWHAFNRAMKAPRPKRRYFTEAELDYLLERLEGVNDPLGIRCVDVLTNLRNR